MGGEALTDEDFENFALDPSNWIVDETAKSPGPVMKFRIPSNMGFEVENIPKPTESIQLAEEWPGFQAMAMDLPSPAVAGPSASNTPTNKTRTKRTPQPKTCAGERLKVLGRTEGHDGYC